MRRSLLLVALTLAGCASGGSLDRPEIFVGRPEAELRDRLGAPQARRDQPDGSRLLTYVRSLTVQYAGLPPPARPATARSEYGWRTGVPEPVQPAASQVGDSEPGCSVTFRVDTSGVVRDWTARGFDCSAI